MVKPKKERVRDSVEVRSVFFVPSGHFPPVLLPFRITGKGQGNVFSFSASVRRFPGWHPEVSSGSASVPDPCGKQDGQEGDKEGNRKMAG